MTAPPLAGLAPIALAEVIDRAALQSRVDRKYVIAVDQLPNLLDQLTGYARVLDIDGERTFRYESVYFDTPCLASYHCAAYRRRRRFKVRTRTYLDSAQCWLEVKISGARGLVTKHRLPYLAEDRRTVRSGRGFVNDVLDRESIRADIAGSPLEPMLVTSYRRSTLLLPATASRVTIDTGLTWQDGDHTLRLPGIAVVETKTSSAPSLVDRILWHRGTRPVRISKYATGLAALRLDLPDVPWRRTLRRHFRANPPAALPELTVPTRSEQEASCA
ncbi:polyphosphate polymerase domain-containing protein [Micromonospora sp. WMMD961]|uniref:polyphosphate polymerase domain-containing protein n=1 Tax=Micromonospora sp. WMMD961 TaxID=3016100 RepID=UPI0024168E1C|nr:polyphosphate polymerase domain-containing protein [Micromonospora sp. WMMD961]MDG4779513.1 polyphosphate polymerase domain-containing protein [Micromonospora sp. WMMD961]